jgi:hypothetical protein
MIRLAALVAGIIAVIDYPVDDFTLLWMFPLALTLYIASTIVDRPLN